MPALLIFPEATQGLRHGIAGEVVLSILRQKPFSAKGFGGSLRQNPFRGHWPRREKGASVGESVPPRVLGPAGPQTGVDADIPAVQGSLPKASVVQLNLTIHCRGPAKRVTVFAWRKNRAAYLPAPELNRYASRKMSYESNDI